MSTIAAPVAATPAAPSSVAAPPPSSSSRIVEIEKKVTLTKRTEELLHGLGFRDAEPAVSIVDTYLDDANCTLTSHNYWLRRRDDRWELKYPAAPLSAKSLAQKASGMSRYEEVAEDGLITAVLQQLFQRAPRPHPVLQAMQIDEEERKKPVHELTLKESDESAWPELMSLVRSHSLFPIVHLRTTRRTLRHQPRNDGAESASALSAAGSSTPAVACPPHPHSAFEVVLDEADYLRDPPGLEGLSLHAFRVAEVEIVLTDPSESDMRDAEARVAEFAALMEPPADDKEKTVPAAASHDSAAASSVPRQLPRGKVERFLALFRPWHYRMLTLQTSAARQQHSA